MTGNYVGKAFHVFFIALLQYHIFSVFIAKQGDRVNGCLFQVTESDNISKGFSGIKNTIGAGIGLHQTVVAQIFIHKKSVQRRRIEACQKHTNYNQQINFLGFNLFSQVTVIVLKTLAIYAEVSFKNCVVVPNRRA